MELQHVATKQTQQEHAYKKQKLQHMPQQQAAMKEQQPMSTQVEKALPLPTRLGLQSVWSAGSGSAAAASGSGAAYSGSAAAASASASAASGIVGAGSGVRPIAAPWNPQICPWQWPDEFKTMKSEMVKTLVCLKASVKGAALPEQHKDDC